MEHYVVYFKTLADQIELYLCKKFDSEFRFKLESWNGMNGFGFPSQVFKILKFGKFVTYMNFPEDSSENFANSWGILKGSNKFFENVTCKKI